MEISHPESQSNLLAVDPARQDVKIIMIITIEYTAKYTQYPTIYYQRELNITLYHGLQLTTE